MANMTEHLNLTLPLGSDRPDINVLNQNFKTIDAACAKESEERNHDIAEVTEALQTEIGRAEDRENEIEAALREETARAAAAEADNRNSITEERQRATAAEAALSEAVRAETVRASAAESANSEAISTEMVRALEAEKKNAAAVEAEEARASAAEQALNNTIVENKPVWEDKYTRSEIDNKFSTFDPAPAFTQASSRVNIESGEKLSVLFGKIKKWFADLKAVAFSGSYNDLTNKPAIPAAVAVKGNAESSYRTGNVNLTAENVGAVSLIGNDIKNGSFKVKNNDSSGVIDILPDETAIYVRNIVNSKESQIDIRPNEINMVTDYFNDDGYDRNGSFSIDAKGLIFKNCDYQFFIVNDWENNKSYISNRTDGNDSLIDMWSGLIILKSDYSIFIEPERAETSTNAFYIFGSDSLYLSKNSSLDLGSSSSKWRNIYATNGTIQTSDRTKKCEIESLEEEASKAFVMGLNPVSYQMSDGTSGRTHYGLIAQDIEDLMTELNMDSKDFAGFIKSPKVIIRDTDEEGKPLKKPIEEVVEGEYDYSLRYDEFIAPLIRLVQSQQNKIDRLTTELSNQQHELDEIKAELSKIRRSGS